MEIWEPDKLSIFLAFGVPGFISVKCYQLLVPGGERNASDQMIDAVAYSSINYALLMPAIIFVEQGALRTNWPGLYYLFYVVVMFIAPIGWAVIWKFLRTREFFQRGAPHPTEKPWDFVFAQRERYWAKVTLKNGEVVAGKYAERSFASSAPADEQIYLEETWVLGSDGAFLRRKHRSAGVLILASEISHVELRSYEEEK